MVHKKEVGGCVTVGKPTTEFTNAWDELAWAGVGSKLVDNTNGAGVAVTVAPRVTEAVH